VFDDQVKGGVEMAQEMKVQSGWVPQIQWSSTRYAETRASGAGYTTPRPRRRSRLNASVKMVGSALKARGEHLKKVEDTRQNEADE
jgi:hypothetical protein